VIEQRDSVMQNGILVPANVPVDPPTLFASTAFEPANAAPDEIVELEVRRAHPFVIDDEGREVTSTTSRPTVAQALREAGVAVGPGDVVTPDLRAAMTIDTRIEVRRAHPVTIALPDGHRVVYTLARTVREVLDEEGITLPQGAFVDPSFDTPITSGLRVRVIQLGSSADVEYEYIESSTVYKADASLDPGETRTVLGQDGVRTRRYAITYVDGEEISRELVEDKLDPEPIDTVIYYPARSADIDDPPPEVAVAGRTLRVYATAYNAASAGRSPDDPYYGITATGVRVTWGVVAVDPDVIPLGTRMFIPGYGYAVAADTGGAVQGYVIDVGYPDGVPIDWTSHWLEIYILE
jgi:3D (Asp-Asp-Asp) domain-containing protein